MPTLRAIVALGAVAHGTVLSAFAAKKSAHPFKHGGHYRMGGIELFSSYHCSRYNTNTGVLTSEMFRAVFKAVRRYLDSGKL